MYMKSPKAATMQKPRVIPSVALAALAVVSLAACSHPSAAVAQRKAQQKAVNNWLNTPSWTPRKCTAPCGAPPPPPPQQQQQQQQHPQH